MVPFVRQDVLLDQRVSEQEGGDGMRLFWVWVIFMVGAVIGAMVISNSAPGRHDPIEHRIGHAQNLDKWNMEQTCKDHGMEMDYYLIVDKPSEASESSIWGTSKAKPARNYWFTCEGK